MYIEVDFFGNEVHFWKKKLEKSELQKKLKTSSA
jgi:hypothetical protein